MPEAINRNWTKNNASRHRTVECPKCNAEILFRRARSPHFDSHGFESYELKCHDCRAGLIGIIDPYYGTPLLSAK
jgi:hypothetical protein